MTPRRISANASNEPPKHMPALPILDKLPIPIVAVGIHGILTYANVAYGQMLGYDDAGTLIGRSLAEMLPEHSKDTARDCLAVLRSANGRIVHWRHADGYPIPTVISEPLPMLAHSPQLLINITDMTERLWNSGSRTHPPTTTRPSHDDTPEPIVA